MERNGVFWNRISEEQGYIFIRARETEEEGRKELLCYPFPNESIVESIEFIPFYPAFGTQDTEYRRVQISINSILLHDHYYYSYQKKPHFSPSCFKMVATAFSTPPLDCLSSWRKTYNIDRNTLLIITENDLSSFHWRSTYFSKIKCAWNGGFVG